MILRSLLHICTFIVVVNYRLLPRPRRGARSLVFRPNATAATTTTTTMTEPSSDIVVTHGDGDEEAI